MATKTQPKTAKKKAAKKVATKTVKSKASSESKAKPSGDRIAPSHFVAKPIYRDPKPVEPKIETSVTHVAKAGQVVEFISNSGNSQDLGRLTEDVTNLTVNTTLYLGKSRLGDTTVAIPVKNIINLKFKTA